MSSSPSRPFFRSSQILNLHKIDNETYKSFILQKFTERNKYIKEETVKNILKWTDTHTYFVQLLLNRLFLFQEIKLVNRIGRMKL